MGSKKNRNGIVYSTNQNYDYNQDDYEEDTLPASEQLLYVSLDSKKRKGKTVTLVEGFIGAKDDLNTLGKLLKSKCGVGGAVKDGEIMIQGQHRDKVIKLLQAEGYKVKSKGG